MSDDPAISLAVRLYGDGLRPETITSLIGIEPSTASKKGDAVVSRSGKVKAHTGAWCLAEDVIEEGVGPAADRLLSRFSGFDGPFARLPDVERASLSLFIGADVSDGWTWEEIELASETVQRLAMLGLSLNITFSMSPLSDGS